ncbi:hypothetical protein SAMN04487974_12714 [Pelagibacterium luteolum]|uniref:Uncharacterized protein n=1 Tax=Pelagibacterium luteolum TaxID=440168 RepID=A0A1G8A866_9HYPH|nr:hypothetical protein SAMN04487974_12714 [Pelagibacterium luteolum]
MSKTDKQPGPSPARFDPHPAREETSAQTSPATRESSSPRMDRELSDDRKLNGYSHDGKKRTEDAGAPSRITRPGDVDESGPKTQRSGDTGETSPEAHSATTLDRGRPNN